MKNFIKSIALVLVCAVAVAFTACSFGAKEYDATDNGYFKFEYCEGVAVYEADDGLGGEIEGDGLTDDGLTDDGFGGEIEDEIGDDFGGELIPVSYYAISAKDVNNLPDEVKIPKTYDDGIHGELPVGAIKNGGFAGATIKKVYLPLNVKIIGDNAFAGCSNLIEAYFYKGAGVQEIGKNAFFKCVCLSELSCPNSLIKIDAYAFWGCLALERVKLPEKTQSIGDEAFAYCSALNYFYIPTALSEIGEKAFIGCDEITYEVSASNNYFKLSNGELVSK